MKNADLIFHLAEIIIISGVVFFTAYFLIRNILRNEQIRRSLENKAGIQKDIILLRLQAYERLVLFLERISPVTLVLRMDKDGLGAAAFHVQLLTVIRAEFEHNLAQQLYVSNDSWNVLLNAKEEVIKLINFSKEKMSDDASAITLAKMIIGAASEKQPTSLAIHFIKSEAAKLF